MSTETTVHLTEEAIDDVLIGLGSHEAEMHLGACATCREKLEAFQANVSAFKQASLTWAESRPTQAIEAPKGAKLGWEILSPAEWALAAAILLFLGLPIWNHAPSRDASMAADVEQADTEQQIAQDNDLLRSIDTALTANEVPSASEYLTPEEPHSKGKSQLRNR